MLVPRNKKFGMVLLRVNNAAEAVRRDHAIKGSVNYVKDFEIYDDSSKWPRESLTTRQTLCQALSHTVRGSLQAHN